MQRHHGLILALVLGALLGTTLHSYSDWPRINIWINTFLQFGLEPLGQVFLRLIFMIVVPMVFTGLVLGVVQLGQHHGLGKVVSKTLFLTVITSAASVLLGIGAVNLIKPGSQVILSAEALSSGAASVQKIQGNASASKPFLQAILELIPKNPIEAAVKALEGEMLALMFFALIFGMALSFVLNKDGKNEKGTLVPVLEEIYNACMRIVEYAMKLAPFAVFALIFSSTYRFGHQLLFSLMMYVLVVVGALAVQQFGVYSLLLKYVGRRSPWKFYKDSWDASIYAFATASSNATLPKSLELAEHKLKISPAISRFVLTVGSTANQNGTALFEGVTVLFLAQVYGIDLSLGQQVQVVLMSILAGIGTAGVPGGSLPLIVILLQQVGIPIEGMALVLGVDRLLDMCRTTVNVNGDLVIAALVDGKHEEKFENIAPTPGSPLLSSS